MWLIHTYDMTHSYVYVYHNFGHTASHKAQRVPMPLSYFNAYVWRIRTCDMTHSYVYVWHDSFICVTWLIQMWLGYFIWGGYN